MKIRLVIKKEYFNFVVRESYRYGLMTTEQICKCEIAFNYTYEVFLDLDGDASIAQSFTTAFATQDLIRSKVAVKLAKYFEEREVNSFLCKPIVDMLLSDSKIDVIK